MVDVLRFTFESFGHFVGVAFLISLVGFWACVFTVHLGKIGRPRKVTTYASTHKM